MQCHPDRHPGDKQAEARFKELNEAYQHLSDSQKRAAYDRYGHAAFEHGGGLNDGFASSMADIFDDLFGDIMGRRGARRRRRQGARRRPALQSRDHSRRGLSRQERDAQAADRGDLRGLRRLRRQGRLQADDLQDLRGPRPGARPAGLLRHRAHLPDLRRPRRDDRQPVRALRRRRPRDARAHAVGQCAGRRRGRHAHPPGRRRRGGPARRRGRRSLHLPLGQAASVLPARRRRSLLPRADLDGAAPRSAASSRCARSTAATRRCAFPRACSRAIS